MQLLESTEVYLGFLLSFKGALRVPQFQLADLPAPELTLFSCSLCLITCVVYANVLWLWAHVEGAEVNDDHIP